MAAATAIVAVMYLCLCFSLAEMAPAIPYAGGAYAFARTAFGPWAGFFTGVAEFIEFVLTPAVIVVGIGSYVGAAVHIALGIDLPAPVWWLVFYAAFVGINLGGVEPTFRMAVVLTLLALGVLVVSWVGAAFHFSWDLALNIEPEPGNSRWLPMGWFGVAQALPFAIWFYLAIEQLPLASEEARSPRRDMPKALVGGVVALIAISVLTLVLNSGIGPGAAGVGKSREPLLLAFESIFGSGLGISVLALVAIVGLVASFHAIIYAYSRRLHSLSRAGYFPGWLSLTHSRTRTPYPALIAGAVIGFGVAMVIEFGHQWFGERAPVGAVLLNMAVFGAVIAYIMQMVSFVRLRRRYPWLHRPYRSLLGSAGAIVAAIIACVTLIFLVANNEHRAGIYGCAIFFAIALLYFGLVGRKRLAGSLEESFALRLEEEERP